MFPRPRRRRLCRSAPYRGPINNLSDFGRRCALGWNSNSTLFSEGLACKRIRMRCSTKRKKADPAKDPPFQRSLSSASTPLVLGLGPQNLRVGPRWIYSSGAGAELPQLRSRRPCRRRGRVRRRQPGLSLPCDAPRRGGRGATQGRSRARLRLRARPPPPNLLLGAVLARARFAARELARGSLRGQVGVVVSLHPPLCGLNSQR